MEILNSSLRCKLVDTLEERIWLDRREVDAFVSRKASRFGRFIQRLRELRIRMQLGPSADTSCWYGDDPDYR